MLEYNIVPQFKFDINSIFMVLPSCDMTFKHFELNRVNQNKIFQILQKKISGCLALRVLIIVSSDSPLDEPM